MYRCDLVGSRDRDMAQAKQSSVVICDGIKKLLLREEKNQNEEDNKQQELLLEKRLSTVTATDVGTILDEIADEITTNSNDIESQLVEAEQVFWQEFYKNSKWYKENNSKDLTDEEKENVLKSNQYIKIC